MALTSDDIAKTHTEERQAMFFLTAITTVRANQLAQDDALRRNAVW